MRTRLIVPSLVSASLLGVLLLGALSLAGCGKTRACKAGTLFLTVDASGAAASATSLDLTITVGGSKKTATTHFSSGMGTLEIDFPAGYPSGKSVSITVDAIAGGAVVASGMGSITLSAGCADLTITLGAPNSDLTGMEPDDGGIISTDMACIPSVTSCPSTVACGKVDDGCGGKLDCGPCQVNAVYQSIANTADTVWMEGVFQAPATVNFPSGATATATVAGANRLSATVPPNAGQGLVTVTSNGVTTSGLPFNAVSYAPAIAQSFITNYEQADYAKAMVQTPTLFFHSSVATDQFVWLFGGYGKKTVYQARINADASLGAFEAAGNLTLERTSSTALRVGSWVYVIGGDGNSSPNQGNSLGSVERAPINSDGTLGTFADAGVSLVTSRWFHQSLVIGDYVYVFGGDNGPYCTGIAQKTIERAKIMPNGDLGAFADAGVSLVSTHANFAAVVNGGFVYIIGGQPASGIAVEVAPIHADGTLGSFTDAGGGLGQVSGGTAHVIGNTLYVIGEGGTAIQTATFKPDGTLNSFVTIGPTIADGNLGGFTTHVIGGYVYALGGGFETVCGAAVIMTAKFTVKRATLDSTGVLDSSFSSPTVALKTSRTARLVAAGSHVYAVGGQAAGSPEVEVSTVKPDGTLDNFSNTTLALTTARTGYGVIVAGDWLYVLGGGSVAAPAGTTIVDAAPIAADGTIGAFALAKSGATTVTLTTARSGMLAIGLTNAICVGTQGSSLECAPLNGDGSLSAGFTVAAGVTVPTGAQYAAVLGTSIWAWGGMSSSVLSDAAITGGGSTASTLGNFAASVLTYDNQPSGSAHDVVGNTLWSFAGVDGLGSDHNSIDKSAINPTTWAPSSFVSASPLVTMFSESASGIIVVGNLLYLIGGTNNGAAVPTTAVLLK